MLEIKSTNTILYCKKWKETVAFYRNKLGLSVNTSRKWFIEFQLNNKSNLSIANEAFTTMTSSQGKGITITLEVKDITATHTKLTESGVNPPQIKNHSWGAKIIHIYDPEGNRVEFWSQN